MSFVPDAPVLLAFTLAGVILFVTPGPDMSLWLAKTVTGGRRAGMAAMLGTSVGGCVHSLLAAAGISALVTASPVAFNAMKVTGALYLLWLAVQAVRRGTSLDVAAPDRRPGGAAGAPFWPTFLTGLGVNLANPKVVIFFITFLPGFVSAADPHVVGKLLFLGLYLVTFSMVLATALILGAARVVGLLRRNPRVLRVVDYAFAGVFGLFAAAILRTQARG